MVIYVAFKAIEHTHKTPKFSSKEERATDEYMAHVNALMGGEKSPESP
jgi:hypothetical protein